ncbi:MAG: DegT/DnrJ/EryC1/StrS family aminotransferase [Longispora sp.]|nr:DegT/DnrJ/EryC1/StrS family aminotransferase [Longispora sp. (in: high G+C Gram-positive bacteria)]
MSDIVALGQPTVGEDELAAIAEVFASGWLAGAGPTCKKFEERFATLAGTSHALATSNCGSALHLAMLTLGVTPGDEVIVGDYTFPATGHSVLYAGATPVFADVRPDIWTIDPQSVEERITPRTRGIIAVDVAGQPADYDELRAIADRHGLFIIEDAACSAGATYRGRAAGSLGDVATFSFHGRKNITAGEGGAFVTDRRELAEHARKLHTYGIAPAADRASGRSVPIPEFDELGYNYRMSDIAAAIMLVQLDRLPALLAARSAIAARYAQLLGDIEHLELPSTLADRTHPWQAYILTLSPKVDRNEVTMRLRARGIQCNIGTYASHLQPLYKRDDHCPVSADVFRRHMAIPMHANLTEYEIETVAVAVREVVTAVARGV